MRVHKIREIYLQTREDLRRGIYYNDDGAKEKRSGKNKCLFAERANKKRKEETKIMKSKKILVVLMAALMALAMVACNNNEPAPTPDPEPTPDPAPTTKVDYSGSLTDWMYTPETEDELTKLLVSIDEVSYGSAGASLQQANAAVAVMKLAMDESGKAQETVKAYLEGMNETQKDYFSFQWQQAMKTALALLNGDEDAAILEDAGDADFDLKAVDSAKTAEFNDAVIQLLSDAGVTNEWKNHTDVEPFLYAAA